MNKILYLLLCGLAWCSDVVLYAVTHPECGHCQRWHSDILPEYDDVANLHNLPGLKVVNYSDASANDWLVKHKINLVAFPTFILMDGENVLVTFPGYSDKGGFYGRLRQELHKIKHPNSKQPLKSAS